MLYPWRLQPGDTVGIVSTSSPVTPQAVETMCGYFVQKGYRVKVAPHTLARTGYLAGPAEVRAADLNELLRDPEVRMVVTAMGGAGAIQLLPLVDYYALAADPKLVVGLSDPVVPYQSAVGCGSTRGDQPWRCWSRRRGHLESGAGLCYSVGRN